MYHPRSFSSLVERINPVIDSVWKTQQIDCPAGPITVFPEILLQQLEDIAQLFRDCVVRYGVEVKVDEGSLEKLQDSFREYGSLVKAVLNRNDVRGNVLSEGEYINVRERLQSLMCRANSFLCTITSEEARADHLEKWMRDNI